MKTIKEALSIIKSGTVQVTPEDDLVKKLAKQKSLIIKLGADPTAPDLHLGHAVCLNKLRQFQDLGHQVIFLIGDFTARIGDPTGRSKTRPAMTEEEIASNATTYLAQVGKILDLSKTIIRYNSEWLAPLTFSDVVKLSGKTTLARIIEREDFQKRLSENVSIGFHELFYPLMQGYDSVALKADVELGGTDQTFNLLMGRYLQEQFGQEPQVIVTLPLLEGLDGINKMSKSYGNYVGLWEDSRTAYGKLMSISDELMWKYFLLLTSKTEADIAIMKEQVREELAHPMNLKKEMAHSVIARYWSLSEADDAQHNFEMLFQKQDYSQAKEVKITVTENPIWIVTLLKELGAIESSSQAKRLIESQAVHVDNQVIDNFKAMVTYTNGTIVKVGKTKIYKIKL